jgi:putative DNA primase/helicase
MNDSYHQPPRFDNGVGLHRYPAYRLVQNAGPTGVTMPAAEIAAILGSAKRNGRGWLCKCPAHPDHTPSLSIMNGDRVPIVVKCFAGCDSREVLAELRRLGLLDDGADHRGDHRGDRRPYRAIHGAVAPHMDSSGTIDRILSRCLPIRGTLAEAYLASRGLDLPVSGDALRYLPPSARYIWPTLVSVISDFATTQTINLQFTCLAHDGSGKAPLPKHEQRRFLAGHRVKGGVVRLSDDADVCLRLGLSEGTESALSIQTSFARAGRREIVWAAVNAGNMAGLPVVPGIETLVVYADKDAGGTGQRAAQELAARWTRAGREAYIALPVTGDWNERGAA